MPLLSSLRKEKAFMRNLLTMLETLKSVAASEYHAIEADKQRFQAFKDAFADFFRMVSFADVRHPLVRSDCGVLGIAMITSDSGFMGSLNMEVIQRAISLQGDRPDAQVSLLVLGEKGAGLLGDRGRAFTPFAGVNMDARYEQAVALREHVVREVKESRIGSLVMVYPHPVSFTQQKIEVESILPCASLFEHSGDAVVQGEGRAGRFVSEFRKVIVESEFSDMVEYLAGVYVTARLYEIFEDSKLAELSARALHLESSSQRLQKDIEKLTLKVFRAAHEMVDKGMRESFSSRRKKPKQEVA